MPTNLDSRVNRDLGHDSNLITLAQQSAEIGVYYFRTLPVMIDVNQLITHLSILNDFYLACYDASILDNQKLKELQKIVSTVSEYVAKLGAGKLVRNRNFFDTLRDIGENLMLIVEIVQLQL